MMLSPRMVTIAPAPFVRGAGCAWSCEPTRGHDPRVHEAYGRSLLLREQAARRAGCVRTGRLVVDLGDRSASVDGARVPLPAREAAILAYLASRVGQLCLHAEIAEACWDPFAADVFGAARSPRRWASVRQRIGKLRQALGPAAALIQTEITLGYRLLALPSEETETT